VLKTESKQTHHYTFDGTNIDFAFFLLRRLYPLVREMGFSISLIASKSPLIAFPLET
jgi:hypothetical protein